MHTNVNLAAPIGAVAFLGTGFILFVAAIALVQSLIVRKTGRAKILLVVMVNVGLAYFAAMLIFSIVSRDRLLARGEEKHFCELDCHLAYSIANVAQAKTIGEGANQARAQGQFTIITIKTRFDETTIGPRRGNDLLFPNGRAFTLVDDRGNRYPLTARAGTPVTTPLRPGETYTTDLGFDLPPEVKPAALLLNESAWETHWLIGHENSLVHGQTKFQI
jgi:hypothetical protein